MNNIIFPILLVLIGFFVGIIIFVVIGYFKGVTAGSKAEKILEKAKKDADKLKRESILESRDEIHRLKSEADREIKEKKSEIKDSEERLLTREGNMDKRDEMLQNREKLLEEKENTLTKRQDDLRKEQVKLEEIKNKQIEELEKISGVDRETAKDIVLKKVEEMMDLEISGYIKDRESEAKLTADKNAKSLIVECMQRYSGDVANEQAVTVVNLPNDEMKGRLIGREGRNIRTIESVTGVDLIIDDTPEAIVLSSFDPLRREIARLTVESLIKDGRIHPTRIEELYDKNLKEVSNQIKEYGQNALLELGITKVDSNLVEMLGKLHYRTSFGQNVLKHSIEVAELAGILASELGENVRLAKRAGILHDIGKSIDHEVEGSHVTIGRDLARKYGEGEIVVNSVESHHGDVEANSIISVLVAVADALSASRPGARNDMLENYIKRLQGLEKVANDFDGVDKAYALQAGREIRVIVKPDEVDDLESHKIARDIKARVEEELQYPGTIKITVVRETRATEEAK